MGKEKKTKKTRRLPSLTQYGIRPMPHVYPYAKRIQTADKLYPISGTNLATARTITFQCECNGGFYRFCEKACFLTAKIKANNVDYKDAPAAGTDGVVPADDRTDLQKKKTRYYTASDTSLYMNPLLNAASFFKSVTVEMNGTRLTKCDLDNGNNIYQHLNRSCCTTDIRDAYTTNKTEPLPSATATGTRTAGYAEGIDLICQESSTLEDDEAVELGFRFSVDGVFALGSSPKNLTCLSVLQKKGIIDNAKTNYYTFIRPGTRIKIIFERPHPHGMFLGNLNAHPAKYNNNVKVTDYAHEWLDPTIEITNFMLYYDVYTFQESISKEIFPKNMRYTRDMFNIQLENLPPNVRDCKVTFRLDKGTKIVYIFFPWEHQIVFDRLSGKGCEFAWTYPETLSKISFWCDGEPLKWREGLTGLASKSANRREADCVNYYEECRNNGIFDNSYDEIFPRSTMPRWKDVIVMDFVEDPINTDKKMIVDMLFEGQGELSPQGRQVACVTVKEEHVWDKEGVWSCK